ncbi:MAG TPA: hypothetical protein VIJ29_04515 [Candidatus Paceibacterota bacterium]
METEELYSTLSRLMEGDDQEAVKKFLIEHIKEFSERDRENILTAFLEDALDKENINDKALLDFQNKAIAAFKRLEAEKAALEKQDKLLEIKENM